MVSSGDRSWYRAVVIAVWMAALMALPAESTEPPREFSVFREVVLLSGVALSVGGTALAAYSFIEKQEWAAVASSALIGVGTIVSLGTAFGSHRWQPPPEWVFVIGPLIGLFAGMAAAFAFD